MRIPQEQEYQILFREYCLSYVVKPAVLNFIRQIFEYNSHSLQMCTRISVTASNVDNKEVKVRA